MRWNGGAEGALVEGVPWGGGRKAGGPPLPSPPPLPPPTHARAPLKGAVSAVVEELEGGRRIFKLRPASRSEVVGFS